MNQPEILDPDIRAMQQWLREAWRQLADASLTAFARKQCNADLRELLQQAAEQRSQPAPLGIATYTKPGLRILAW